MLLVVAAAKPVIAVFESEGDAPLGQATLAQTTRTRNAQESLRRRGFDERGAVSTVDPRPCKFRDIAWDTAHIDTARVRWQSHRTRAIGHRPLLLEASTVDKGDKVCAARSTDTQLTTCARSSRTSNERSASNRKLSRVKTRP